MQRFCDGCRCAHDLGAFDLDSGEARAVCRAYSRKQARDARSSARRRAQLKIEDLEQQRRGLIAALVKIDQEIAKERALQTAPAPLMTSEDNDVFGERDLESGD